MSEHLSPAEIRAYRRGTLLPSRRRQVMAHLADCEQCARALAGKPAAGTARRRPGKAARPSLGETARAQARQIIAASRYGRERAAFARLIEAVREGERSWADLTLAEREAFQGLPLVELLIEQSRALRHRDPGGMIHFAALARMGVERLDGRRYGAAFIADWRARACTELANAYRVADDLDEAEEALTHARSWARRGSGDPEVLARLADVTASWLSDAGCFRDGIALLERVQDAYFDLGERHLAGRALLKEGILTGNSGDPREGILRITEAMSLLDFEREPALALAAVHNIVDFLIACGQYRRARLALWQHRRFYLDNGDRLNLLRLRWIEGKIHAGLGDAERAERALEDTRHGFQEVGKIYDAALAGLDLALFWLEQGEHTRIAGLLGELIATFKIYRIAREAIAVLLVAREWCDKPDVPDDVLRDKLDIAVVLVRELERQRPRRRRVRRSRSAPGWTG